MQSIVARTTLAVSLSALLLAAPALGQEGESTSEDATATAETMPADAGSGEQADAVQAGETPGAVEPEAPDEIPGDMEPAAGDEAQSAPETPANTSGMDAASSGAADAADAGEAPGSTETDMAGGQTQSAEMPQAATPQGQGLSDLTTGGPSDQGRTVMLDIEGFSQAIYERGYRQGYLRGIADARERFMVEMQRMNAQRQQMMEQRPQTQPGGQQSGGSAMAPGQPAPQGQRDMPQGGSGGERGSIIVLPPGVSPEMFIERLMQMNEGAQGN